MKTQPFQLYGQPIALFQSIESTTMTVDGVPFNVQGEKILGGQFAKVRLGGRRAVQFSLMVGRSFEELHLLHFAKFSADPIGAPIAVVRFHYRNGATHNFDIVYGAQVLDFIRTPYEGAEILTDPNSKVVFRGPALPEVAGSSSRLFATVLVNPRPTAPVEAIEFISAHNQSCYGLIAATVASRDAGRAMTAPLAPPGGAPSLDGNLRVRVFDQLTGQPLHGATVMLSPNFHYPWALAVLSSTKGEALLRYPSAEAKTFSVSASGRGFVSANVSGSSMSSTVLTLHLARTAAASTGNSPTSAGKADIASPAIFRAISLADALKAAAAEKKIVVLNFYTTWCEPCILMDRTTWRDLGVSDLLMAKAVPVSLDAEKETALADQYKIEGYPTTLLLRDDGTEIDRELGYRDAAGFIANFNSALAGKSGSQIDARYRQAQSLANAGKSAEALQEYLWLFDIGMKQDPSFRGVRTSFLVSSIESLAKAYPPAADALRSRRDIAEKSIGTDTTQVDALMEFSSINRALNEEDRTFAVYDRLAPADPRRQILVRADFLRHSIFHYLLKAGRYQDAAEVQPVEGFLMRSSAMAKFLDSAKSGPDITEEQKAAAKNGAATSALDEIEALAGAGRLDDARKVIARLRSLYSSKETEDALQRRLVRAGHPKLANAASNGSSGRP